MNRTEAAVAAHYTTGALYDRILGALGQMGIDPARARPADLKPGDEFHTGGVAATEALLDQVHITPDMAVLDVGAGIGGTSRYVADRFGARVTGVDLTPEFVDTANALNRLVGLSDRVTHQVGSALQLPLANDAFDVAVMMHVGMNIEDKRALLHEVARVLRPGGTFALFDVMKGAAKTPLTLPLPWAERPETSFLADADEYETAAAQAGFALTGSRDRSAFAEDFFAKVFAAVERDGPPPLGIHLMMGDSAPLKLKNYVANLKAGRVAPTEMIFRLTR
ncbi:class I SAM-dependent methyltransferase [Actibacterium ureilyticum]|uniref:class I SAM-dependent methyltransferase n=1 Tax=Actibacterium ureilyticum TaxID=1590614 RepID=UPI001594EF64|nr:methyltransferase domain-containing protein [Actibacterium ureilyticum]